MPEDPFRHLNHPHYLRRGLTNTQRVRYAYEHYAFESRAWKSDYHQAIYAQASIELWRCEIEGTILSTTLQASPRINNFPEGELEICFKVGDVSLHRMSFNWLVAANNSSPTLFISRSQGVPRSHNSSANAAIALGEFRRLFRQVSAPFFCFASVQGLARVVGAGEVYGVRCFQQTCAETESEVNRFQVAYDDFWRALGGRDENGEGFLIPLPVRSKLSHTPKESRKLRSQWADIEASTVSVLQALRNPMW